MSELSNSLSAITNSKVDVKELGGNYVLLYFESRKAMMSCLKYKAAWEDKCFQILKEWEDGDCTTQRRCCLNIYGVPPQAWCKEFFELIAVRYGSFLKLVNELEGCNNLEVAKMQLMTTHKEPIHQSFQVKISNIVYEVVVVEVQPVLTPELVGSFKGDDTTDDGRDDSAMKDFSSSQPEVFTPRPAGDQNDEDTLKTATQKSLDPFGIHDVIKYMEKGKSVLGDVVKTHAEGMENEQESRVEGSEEYKNLTQNHEWGLEPYIPNEPVEEGGEKQTLLATPTAGGRPKPSTGCSPSTGPE
ncbi:hypothetical protein Tsubulata_030097 [Turnera subulata]|uniref:DUF4283 domain-containing protein n=1 Tax=Turnera subulata TaxID=218843 RepID=A0A9Q0EYK0_9ROSI|nr:hypothetical protein Tsubulata_030097 [Turnera subulata]